MFQTLLAERFKLVIHREMKPTDIDLQWTPDSRSARADDNAANKPPTIFTSIQEQLGLRLRAQKVPVEVIVIDHAEKPEPN